MTRRLFQLTVFLGEIKIKRDQQHGTKESTVAIYTPQLQNKCIFPGWLTREQVIRKEQQEQGEKNRLQAKQTARLSTVNLKILGNKKCFYLVVE